MGEEKQKNTILRELLEDFAKPELDLKPSKVGTLDIIDNAYEYLIKNFAASGGQKAGEFYTPPEVSDLIAEMLDPQMGDNICDPVCGSGSLFLKTKSIRAYFSNSTSGSSKSMVKINKSILEKTALLLPPLEEQIQIA